MNESELNEVGRHFVLQKVLFSVFVPLTAHFEQILNAVKNSFCDGTIIYRK